MFDAINWTQPWLADFVPVLQAAIGSRGGSDANANYDLEHWRDTFNDAAAHTAIENHRGRRLQFVDQAELQPGTAYEAFISQTGQVPSRPNLHDFFNALVWLTYPRSKAQLNALQAAELARRRDDDASPDESKAGSTRGAVRDRATIFDENAALLISADPTIERALQTHAWHEALVEHRAAFGVRCEVRLFGHALIEKLVNPYKAITAHVWILHVDAAYFALPAMQKRALVDSLLYAQLQQRLLDTAPTPLPVLGVPGWWAAQDRVFYADAAVFRPQRLARPK